MFIDRSYTSIALEGPFTSSELLQIDNKTNEFDSKSQKWDGKIRAMTFSPDGSLVAILTAEDSIRLFPGIDLSL
ncbi:hypothetical protein HMI56_002971 [Coelomomyces lativittatus]|nr:hypothetical protein HMI56_002971 [Coelomomyces lativittatus]